MLFYHLIGPAYTRTFRCIWMLEELGLDYKLHFTMPQTRGVKKFNPTGKVPVLIETTTNCQRLEDAFLLSSTNSSSMGPSSKNAPFILAESVAINNYLGDKHQGSSNHGLVPKQGTRERALYDQTILFVLSELDAQALWMYRKHISLGRFFGHVPEMEESCQTQFRNMNQQVADQLKRNSLLLSSREEEEGNGTAADDNDNGRYLLGSQFTAADILYVHCLDWAKVYGWDANYEPHVLAYLKRCKQRPAYQRARAIRDAAVEAQQQKQDTKKALSLKDTKVDMENTTKDQSRL